LIEYRQIQRQGALLHDGSVFGTQAAQKLGFSDIFAPSQRDDQTDVKNTAAVANEAWGV